MAVVPDSNTPAASTADTPMEITGPAAGHERMRTKADPTGAASTACSTTAPAASRRGARGSPARRTSTAISRASSRDDHRKRATTSATAFPATGTPGASSTTASTSPRSRTKPTASAGSSRSIRSTRPRCRRSAPRSAASSTKAPPASSTKDGRYVVYSGDDERFDYVYKFVTAGTVDPNNRAANIEPARRGHALRRAVQRRRQRRMAAARARPGPADGGQRLQEPGRRADRDAARRRPARRHQDGPPGGRRGQSARPTRST